VVDEPIVVRRPSGPPPLALRFAAVLVVPLLLYALVATGQRALDNYRMNQETEALQAEVVGLRAENIQLQQDIERARTDTAIETIAREQLGLIKPGDQPVVLVSPASQPGAASTRTEGTGPPTAPNPPAPAPPVWRQWWDYVFG
jgi:cell division protein FtsL